jgi:hypothetical protein
MSKGFKNSSHLVDAGGWLKVQRLSRGLENIRFEGVIGALVQ